MVKKILAIFGIVLLCSGCCENSWKTEGVKVDGKEKSPSGKFSYKEIDVKGHNYLYFRDGMIIHDPECKKCYEQFD